MLKSALCPWEGGRTAPPSAVLQVLLFNLRQVHAIWRQKEFVSDATLAAYASQVEKFAAAWNAFLWKGTVWVHWVIAHSTFLLRRHRSLYIFTSIPTEHKHKGRGLSSIRCMHAMITKHKAKAQFVAYHNPLREWLRKVEDLTKLRGVSAAVKTFAFVGGGHAHCDRLSLWYGISAKIPHPLCMHMASLLHGEGGGVD